MSAPANRDLSEPRLASRRIEPERVSKSAQYRAWPTAGRPTGQIHWPSAGNSDVHRRAEPLTATERKLLAFAVDAESGGPLGRTRAGAADRCRTIGEIRTSPNL
jgi:hypothetical protein